jgi:hypothetical protein
MKVLWTQEESEFKGEFCSFPKVRMYPKPVQKPHPPIIFGGESAPALKRVGEVGDGWFGVNVTPEAAPGLITRMKNYAQAAGRDPEKLTFAVSPGIGSPIDMDTIKKFLAMSAYIAIAGGIPSDQKMQRGYRTFGGEASGLVGEVVGWERSSFRSLNCFLFKKSPCALRPFRGEGGTPAQSRGSIQKPEPSRVRAAAVCQASLLCTCHLQRSRRH